MPSLGADMDAGLVTEWRVRPGDAVRRGDIVAVVETDKADVEVEIFQDGVVEEILVPEGTRVAVGTALARIRGRGEIGEAPPAPAPRTPAPPPAASPVVRKLARDLHVDLAAVSGTGPGGAATRADVERAAAERIAPPAEAAGRRARISPLARRRAAELGLDPSSVRGTGPGGAVTRADVERAAAERIAAPPPIGPVPGRPPAPEVGEVPAERPLVAEGVRATQRQLAMRRAIAAIMARANREIPHYYLGTRVDMRRAMEWLEAENARRRVTERLLPSVLLLRATALAVHEVPEMNGFVVDERFQPSEAVHLGVAISLRQGGLIAPAIHDADRKSLDELMRDLRDLVQRTRAGRLRSSEMADPTITVTNLGELGVEVVYGVIYAPQVSLVGFGRILERPWAESGMVGVRPVVEATLAADHRASDGHRGGLFLAAIDRLLQEPEDL